MLLFCLHVPRDAGIPGRGKLETWPPALQSEAFPSFGKHPICTRGLWRRDPLSEVHRARLPSGKSGKLETMGIRHLGGRVGVSAPEPDLPRSSLTGRLSRPPPLPPREPPPLSRPPPTSRITSFAPAARPRTVCRSPGRPRAPRRAIAPNPAFPGHAAPHGESAWGEGASPAESAGEAGWSATARSTARRMDGDMDAEVGALRLHSIRSPLCGASGSRRPASMFAPRSHDRRGKKNECLVKRVGPPQEQIY